MFVNSEIACLANLQTVALLLWHLDGCVQNAKLQRNTKERILNLPHFKFGVTLRFCENIGMS